MALVLSELDLNCPEALASRLRPLLSPHEIRFSEPLALISFVILHRRVRDLVRSLYPTSEGLVGILSKLGGEPLREETYRLLVDLHTQRQHRPRAMLLRHAPRIPERTFPVIMALEPPYLSLKLVKCLGSVEQVKDFQRSIELIKRVIPSISDDVLVSSLDMIAPGTSLGQWVQRWLERATCFWVEPPDLRASGMAILESAFAMREAGRRYKNCLETRIGFVALGRSLFLEYEPRPCIVELERLHSGWVFSGVYGAENLAVDSAIAQEVIEKLHTAGIHIPARHLEATYYNRVARIAGIFDFSRDDFGLIDDGLAELERELAESAHAA